MANGNKVLPPGRTRQQRHYRNGGKEQRAKWRARPEVAKRLVERTARWRALNPEKHQAYLDRTRTVRREQGTRANWRRKGYPEPTRPMPAACECCGGNNNRRRLHLDHCHETGKFRGWLCTNCNTAIGKLGDTIMGVARAIDYLWRA